MFAGKGGSRCDSAGVASCREATGVGAEVPDSLDSDDVVVERALHQNRTVLLDLNRLWLFLRYPGSGLGHLANTSEDVVIERVSSPIRVGVDRVGAIGDEITLGLRCLELVDSGSFADVEK